MFDQHVIETPENISFDYQVAGIGSRFLAILVDTLIQGALYLALAVVYVLVEAVLGTATRDSPSSVAQWIPAIILLVTLFVIQFGYFIIFEITLGGRTPGKELAGLRVIKESGQPLTALDSIIRNLVRIIDFLPFGYGVGVIAMFFNARSKRLGDFAAGTLVVRVDKPVKLIELTNNKPTFGIWVDATAVAHLKETDIELIESYLQRRGTLQNAAALGASIEQRIRALTAMPKTDQEADANSSVRFLEQVVAAYRTKQSNR